PGVYNQMYEALVTLKYFDRSPASTRAFYRGLAFGIIALGAFACFGAFALTDAISGAIVAVPLAIIIVGVVGMVFARIMPHKTDFGSEQAARWRAFQRYLQNMRQYGNLDEAAKRFDQYLPYAIALGVQQDMVRQFESVSASM